MEEFNVLVENRPGQLARVCDALYKSRLTVPNTLKTLKIGGF